MTTPKETLEELVNNASLKLVEKADDCALGTLEDFKSGIQSMKTRYGYICGKCECLVAEPMKTYSYSGEFCHCLEPTQLAIVTTVSTGHKLDYYQVCTCNSKCPVHDKIKIKGINS